MVAFGEVGKLLGLLFERPARLFELRNGGQKLPLGVEEPLFITKPTETRRPGHQPDGRGKQERRDHHRVTPAKEMTLDGRSKRHPRESAWQHPHSGKLITIPSGLD